MVVTGLKLMPCTAPLIVDCLELVALGDSLRVLFTVLIVGVFDIVPSVFDSGVSVLILDVL